MSDINGTGFGSAHNWEHLHGGRGYSPYRCRHCQARFTHYYDQTPDIFEAIKKQNVAEACVEWENTETLQ